jgi:hypothetical protein
MLSWLVASTGGTTSLLSTRSIIHHLLNVRSSFESSPFLISLQLTLLASLAIFIIVPFYHLLFRMEQLQAQAAQVFDKATHRGRSRHPSRTVACVLRKVTVANLKLCLVLGVCHAHHRVDSPQIHCDVLECVGRWVVLAQSLPRNGPWAYVVS